MSAVRGMINEGESPRAPITIVIDLQHDDTAKHDTWPGGSKEALAAIYALRQRNTITGQLDASCLEFTAHFLPVGLYATLHDQCEPPSWLL